MSGMKARLTTLLSLTGVLVAGSAAALVNTQVLQGTSQNKSTASEISVTDTKSDPSKAVDKFGQLAPAIVSPSVSTQFSYRVGEAGLVVLDTAGGVLTIVSTTPNAEWSTVGSENRDPLHVDIKLQSATVLIEFTATLSSGQITTSVESTDLSTSTSGGSSVGGSGGSNKGGHDQKEPSEHHGGSSGGKDDGGDDD